MKTSEIPDALNDYQRLVVEAGWTYDPEALELMRAVAAGQTLTEFSRERNVARAFLDQQLQRVARALQEVTAERINEYQVARYLPVTYAEVRAMVERGELHGERLHPGRNWRSAQWHVSLREVRQLLNDNNQVATRSAAQRGHDQQRVAAPVMRATRDLRATPTPEDPSPADVATLGRRIRYARRYRRMPIAALAAHIDYPEITLYRLEWDRRVRDHDACLQLIATALDVTYAWLATGSGDLFASDGSSAPPEPESIGTIGKRCRHARALTGLTLMDLACRVGVSRAVMTRIEADTLTRIPFTVLGDLSAVLGVSVNWLARGDGVPPTRHALS